MSCPDPGGFRGAASVSATPYLEALCENLAAYIRDAKLTRPVVAGHSLGGVAALWLAAKRPELPGAVYFRRWRSLLSRAARSLRTADSMRSQALLRLQQSSAMTRSNSTPRTSFCSAR